MMCCLVAQSISPGLVDTEMWDPTLSQAVNSAATIKVKSNTGVMHTLCNGHVMGGLSGPRLHTFHVPLPPLISSAVLFPFLSSLSLRLSPFFSVPFSLPTLSLKVGLLYTVRWFRDRQNRLNTMGALGPLGQ